MIGYLILGGAVVGMYRIADMESRSGLLWALITLLYCIGASFLLGGFLAPILGFVAAFVTMTAAKLLGK